jgi:hypothetical protein
LQVFKDDIKQYELTKSAIRIPNDKHFPAALLTRIIKYGAKQNLETAIAKGKIKL